MVLRHGLEDVAQGSGALDGGLELIIAWRQLTGDGLLWGMDAFVYERGACMLQMTARSTSGSINYVANTQVLGCSKCMF